MESWYSEYVSDTKGLLTGRTTGDPQSSKETYLWSNILDQTFWMLMEFFLNETAIQ